MSPPRPTPVLSQRRPVVLLDCWPVRDGYVSMHSMAELAGESSDKFAFGCLLPVMMSRAILREAGSLYRFLPSFWYVLVGTETRRALGKRALPARRGMKVPELEWYESTEGIVLATIPRPSPGKNHWYDDPQNRRRASRFLRAAASPPGSRVDQRFRQALARAK